MEGRVGNMQSRLFTFLGPTLGASRWRGVALGAGSMADPTVCGELLREVRVRCRAVIWAGVSRFPLRARGG